MSPRTTCCWTIFVSSAVSLTRLAQHRVRDPDLAHVVEQAGGPDRGDRRVIETDPAGQKGGVAGDIVRVPFRVAVLGVDREDKSLEDVEAGLARFFGLFRPGDTDVVAAARLGRSEGRRDCCQEHRQGRRVMRVADDPGTDRDRQAVGGVDLEAPLDQPGPDLLERWLRAATWLAGTITRNSSGPYRPMIDPSGAAARISSRTAIRARVSHLVAMVVIEQGEVIEIDQRDAEQLVRDRVITKPQGFYRYPLRSTDPVYNIPNTSRSAEDVANSKNL